LLRIANLHKKEHPLISEFMNNNSYNMAELYFRSCLLFMSSEPHWWTLKAQI